MTLAWRRAVGMRSSIFARFSTVFDIDAHSLPKTLSFLAFLLKFCPYFHISFTHSPSDTGFQIVPTALTWASSHCAHFIGLLYAYGFNYKLHPEYLNLYQKPKPLCTSELHIQLPTHLPGNVEPPAHSRTLSSLRK